VSLFNAIILMIVVLLISSAVVIAVHYVLNKNKEGFPDSRNRD